MRKQVRRILGELPIWLDTKASVTPHAGDECLRSLTLCCCTSLHALTAGLANYTYVVLRVDMAVQSWFLDKFSLIWKISAKFSGRIFRKGEPHHHHSYHHHHPFITQVHTVKKIHILSILYLLWKSCTRHSRLENINEYKNTQLYKPIGLQYTHSATCLLTRNAADEHVNLISIKIKRICSITTKQEFQ